MVNIKNLALTVGITAMASLAAIPGLNGNVARNVDTGSDNPIVIFNDNDGSESTDTVETVYMSARSDIYDSNINADDYAAYLHNASPDGFKDPIIREDAASMSSYYDIRDAKYEAMCYGTGIGFGDYLFTEGYSFTDEYSDDGGDFIYTVYTVKCTKNEFKSYLDELKSKNDVTVISEHQYDELVVGLYEGSDKVHYTVQYDSENEVLVQEASAVK